MLVMALPSHASDGAIEFCWQWHCRVLLVTALLSPSGYGVAKSCWRWRCRGDVGRAAMSLPRQLGCGVMSLLSHVGDVAAEVTGPWHDVFAMMCNQSQDVPTLFEVHLGPLVGFGV
jgi:hypothetical protein